jgi:serine/threonine protein kinase
MAPERIDGRSYTFNSDVWSLGLTMLTVAQGTLSVDTANGYWSILNSIRDKEPPRLPDNGKWSADFRDFIAQCLTQSPANRPSCTELLKHPFIRRAAPDTGEEDAAGCTARGVEDLESIIAATHTHLMKLKEDYERVSLSAKTPSSGVTNHLLAHAIEAQGVDEVLKLLLFGKEPSLRGNDAFDGSSQNVMSHRLLTLAQQLQLSLSLTLREARRIYTDVVGTNFNSDPNLRIHFEGGGKSGVSDHATPKARHG